VAALRRRSPLPAPANDGGGTLSAYNVYRAVGGGSESLLASTGGSETTYIDFAVTNGTAYTYRVTAVNAAGEGAYSNAVTVTPGPASTITAPTAPQSLTVKPKGTTTLVLKWAAPSGDGGSPIASYFVYRRGPGETEFTLIDVTASLTYGDGGIVRRSTYTYYVTAFNAYFEGPASNSVTVKSK
jgi:titin